MYETESYGYWIKNGWKVKLAKEEFTKLITFKI